MTFKPSSPFRSRVLNAERLEDRTVLNGTALVQPFSEVAYFGGDREWGLNAVNAPEVWARGYTGRDVVVAVIDTGVDRHHEQLAGSIWVNEDEIVGNNVDDDNNGFIDDRHGWNFVEYDAIVQDVTGHGTHISGVIVAAADGAGTTGVAYDAQIMPIRVLGADGYGSQIDIAAGILYAVDNGADIINLSFGGLGSRRVAAAIEHALDQDVLIVAAAGNDSEGVPDYPARYSATYENVISVEAYNESRTRAEFSNRVGISGAVQVAAPGDGIYSTGLENGHFSSSGSSLSAAYTSGVAALVLSANPNLDALQLRETIVEGANQSIDDSDAVGGLNAGYSVAIAARGQAEPTRTGDIDQNGRIDFQDFLILARNFGNEVEDGIDPITVGDLNGDGVVGFFDFVVFSREFNNQ